MAKIKKAQVGGRFKKNPITEARQAAAEAKGAYKTNPIKEQQNWKIQSKQFEYNKEKEKRSESPVRPMKKGGIAKNKMKTGGTLAPSKKSVGKTIGKLNKAKKGGSFPDLNKDGKVTKKDVLIGKGVLPKTAKKGAKMTKKCRYGCK